jgi:hypothetical protein
MLMVGFFSVLLNLDETAGGVEETLICGTGGGAAVFLVVSSMVLIVGTAGDVTALDNGRGLGPDGRVSASVDPYTSSLSSISL